MVRMWFRSNADGWWELKVERRRHVEARPIDTGYWPLSVLLTQVRDTLEKFGTKRAPPVRQRRRSDDGGRKK